MDIQALFGLSILMSFVAFGLVTKLGCVLHSNRDSASFAHHAWPNILASRSAQAMSGWTFA
jgi:hypothetical protein